jgi:hypothetical protein
MQPLISPSFYALILRSGPLGFGFIFNDLLSPLIC